MDILLGHAVVTITQDTPYIAGVNHDPVGPDDDGLKYNWSNQIFVFNIKYPRNQIGRGADPGVILSYSTFSSIS